MNKIVTVMGLFLLVSFNAEATRIMTFTAHSQNGQIYTEDGMTVRAIGVDPFDTPDVLNIGDGVLVTHHGNGEPYEFVLSGGGQFNLTSVDHIFGFTGGLTRLLSDLGDEIDLREVPNGTAVLNWFGVSRVVLTTSGSSTVDNFEWSPVTGPPPDNGPGPEPTPVPEPATFALLGLGLAGMGFAHRRKAKKLTA